MRLVDVVKEFLEKYFDVWENVVDYYMCKKGGDVFEGLDVVLFWWIVFFLVVFWILCRDLLERVVFIEKNFDYEFDFFDD